MKNCNLIEKRDNGIISQKNSIFWDFVWVMILIILLTFFLFTILDLSKATINIPLQYEEDALFYCTQIKGTIENYWQYTNPYLGAPFGSILYDYAMINNLDYIIIKIISLFFNDFGTTINIYYLLTYYLVAISSFICFRLLGFSRTLSLLGSISFSLLPYHFLRGQYHLFLSAYYLIPFVILVTLWIYYDKEILIQHSQMNKFSFYLKNRASIFSIFIAIMISGSFTNYPFLSILFFLWAGLCAAMRVRNYYPVIRAFILSIITALFVFIQMLPMIINNLTNGFNHELYAIRHPAGSEIYGLKIIQLILPVIGHRIDFMSDFTNRYMTSAPLINENIISSLGVFASIGFVLLLLWIIYNFAGQNIFYSIGNRSSLLSALCSLNLFAILLGSIGGYVTILSYFLFSQIRGTNRISIFIAFFAIIASLIILEYIKKNLFSNKSSIFIIIILILIPFVVMDQTSQNFIPKYEYHKNTYDKNQEFFLKINDILPDGSMVYQLPYSQLMGPSNIVGKIGPYESSFPYLHTKGIKWSYGSPIGRYGEQWQLIVNNMDEELFIQKLIEKGFSGILIDGFGYNDNGNNLSTSISELLGSHPMRSNDGRYYFFYLNKEKNTNTGRINQLYDQIVAYWGEGFSSLESDEFNTWRWCDKKGEIKIYNPYVEGKMVNISMTLLTFNPLSNKLSIVIDDEITDYLINSSGINFLSTLELKPGYNSIRFQCNAAYIPSSERNIVFQVRNFKMVMDEVVKT